MVVSYINITIKLALGLLSIVMVINFTGKGNLVFASGQIPVDPATGEVAGPDIAAQAEQSCKNVKAVIEAGGSDISKVFKTTCFLADMADFATFNSIYEKYFTSKPARSCVAVKTLPKNVLCEIEAIAEI